MSQNISISVPYDYVAISSAADMLTLLAEDIKKSEVTTTVEPEANPVPAPATVAPVPPAEPIMEEDNGVELDANGLPWDERIHASSKTKDVKGFWKYKRGVDRDVLVPEVEAELKAMMGETPEPPAPPAPSSVVAPPAKEVFTTSEPPVTPAAPSTDITTFAQLVTAITSADIQEEKVQEALEAVDLSNFALLGARPDLIPTVARHLGL